MYLNGLLRQPVSWTNIAFIVGAFTATMVYGDDGAHRDPAIRLYTIANYAYYHIGFRPLLYL